MTDAAGKTAAAQGLHRRPNPATLPQLHEPLGMIERRLLSVGGGLALLMRVDRFLEGGA